jgi:hypothetical protein
VSVDDVEGMWGALHHVPRPSTIHLGSTYYFFRSDVAPRWEHRDNEIGGQWILMVRHDDVRARAQVLDTLWEEFVIAALGESLDGGKKQVNGVVCKVRAKQFTLQVWTRSCVIDTIRGIGEELRKAVADVCPELKSTTSNVLEFYSHQQLEGCGFSKGAYGGARPQPMLVL